MTIPSEAIVSRRGLVIDPWFTPFYVNAPAAGFTAQIAARAGVVGSIVLSASAAGVVFTLQDGIAGGPIIWRYGRTGTFVTGTNALMALGIRYITGLYATVTGAAALYFYVGHREA